MGGILSVVAQSAVLTIQVPQEALGVEIKEVHHERAIQRDSRSSIVNVGDFYLEESRGVIIEVTLVHMDSTIEDSPSPWWQIAELEHIYLII